jgi:hypothetical protein
LTLNSDTEGGISQTHIGTKWRIIIADLPAKKHDPYSNDVAKAQKGNTKTIITNKYIIFTQKIISNAGNMTPVLVYNKL